MHITMNFTKFTTFLIHKQQSLLKNESLQLKLHHLVRSTKFHIKVAPDGARRGIILMKCLFVCVCVCEPRNYGGRANNI